MRLRLDEDCVGRSGYKTKHSARDLASLHDCNEKGEIPAVRY